MSATPHRPSLPPSVARGEEAKGEVIKMATTNATLKKIDGQTNVIKVFMDFTTDLKTESDRIWVNKVEH